MIKFLRSSRPLTVSWSINISTSIHPCLPLRAFASFLVKKNWWITILWAITSFSSLVISENFFFLIEDTNTRIHFFSPSSGTSGDGATCGMILSTFLSFEVIFLLIKPLNYKITLLTYFINRLNKFILNLSLCLNKIH